MMTSVRRTSGHFLSGVLPFSAIGAALLAGALLAATPAPAPQQAGAQQTGAPITGAQIAQAGKTPQNWLTFYGNYQAWSYSALDQINGANVKRLVPAWAFATGGHFGLQSAPLVADGTLYLVDPEDNIFAVDAVTGAPLWKFAYKRPESEPNRAGNRAVGLAMGYGMIFEGTSNDHLLAVDAKTGQQVWDVEVESSEKCGCGINSPPIVVKDMVITGGTGGERAHRGYLSAYDARTGKLDWRFYTIPEPGQPGAETWSGDSWKVGGGTTWLTGSYDPELNLVYWGVGNPSSDFYGEERPGANLYTNSLIALDADTGKLKWYFQEIPHDLNDYDADPEPVLFDAPGPGGQTRKFVLHSNKSGFAYLLDRETGQLIRAFPYVDNITWTKGLDAKGMPIDPVAVESGKQFLFCPGALGGHNRNHSAYSPLTGWWYSSANETCAQIHPVKMTVKEGDPYFGGTMDEVMSTTSVPHITAFDPVTGKKQWTFPTNFVNASSLLATAGDLIFGGDIEGNAFALSARNGQKLWSFQTGGRIAAPAISYAVNGKQYVAIATGGGAIAENALRASLTAAHAKLPEVTSTLFVFALPDAQ